jgi:hypothetical protein
MRVTLVVGLLLAAAACANAQDRGQAGGAAAVNVLSDEEKAQGWQLLFDGRTLNGWRAYREGEPVRGWEVVEGALTRTGSGGDIVTAALYRNFELALEWKVAPGGNSGIFYRAAPGSEWIYHSAPEMQVLDDASHRDGGSRLTAAGAAYGLYPAPEGVVRPAGEWNQVRIRVDGYRVEHWLNGTRIVAYELQSPQWKELVARTKFAEWPEYGMAQEGFIGLQDHGDRVAYRNIRIRILP